MVLQMRIIPIFLLLAAGMARADMGLDQFLGKAFAGVSPEPRMLWLTPPVKQRAAAVLGHGYAGLRVKYWAAGSRTAWVIDEIGKERPITIGVVVEQGHIREVDILAYRESRGSEVGREFFTRQFSEAGLKGSDDGLSRGIDGITGATLSVSAVTRVSRLALVFDQEAGKQPAGS
jgi:hypothetical protein